MEKPRLDPEALDVTSFETAYASDAVLQPGTLTINDPTAATRCFICPPRTQDCW